MKRHTTARDEGAVLVLMAFLIVVLLGVGALVIDIGRAYVEKRQVQNGADAAALAVAQECARTGNCGDEDAMATTYALGNGNNDMDVIEVCGDGPGLDPCTGGAPPGATGASGWVKVITENDVDYVLAPVMNAAAGATIDADATAAWGPLGSYLTIRFIISECEYQQMGGDIATNTVPPLKPAYIYSKRGNDNTDKNTDPQCVSSSSGGTISGNFAWLDGSANDVCRALVTAGGTVGGKPGNDPEISKQDCAEVFDAMQAGEEFVLPIYNQVDNPGQPAVYTVAGFVGFKFTGWKLSGNTWPQGFSCPDPYTGGNGGGDLRCFRGEFTRVMATGGFGGIDYGVTAVKMID